MRERQGCCVVFRIDSECAAPFTRREIVLTASRINAPEIVAGFGIPKILELQRGQQRVVSLVPTAGTQEHDAEIVVGTRVFAIALVDRGLVSGDRWFWFAEA